MTGGGPSQVEGENPRAILPLFPETDMPSARQDGLIVGAVDSNGDVKLAIAGNGKWYLFTHDSTVT